MALKDKDLDSFNKILYDVFDMDKQKTWNQERRVFAQEIEKGLVSKELTKAFVGRLVVDLLNLTSKSQYEKHFPDWAKINASGIFVAALIGDLLQIKKATGQVKEKIQSKKLNLDIRLEESEDVDSICNFMKIYDPKFERISTTVGKRIPEKKVYDLVLAIKALNNPVKYVIFQAIRFPNESLFDEIIGKATNRLQIFYTHKVDDDDYMQITSHIQEKMNELDLPGQANVYTVTNHKKRYELIRKQVEETHSGRVLEPSAFGEHIKTIDLRKHIPDDVLEQLKTNIPEEVKLYLWMSTEKEVQNFYRLVTKVPVEIDLMQIFLDKEHKTKDFIQNSLIFECLKQKNAKFVTLTICSIESRDLFIDHVKNILPQVTNKLDLRTNIKFTPDEQLCLKQKFTALMACRPKWQKLELHFIGKQHVIYGDVTDESRLTAIALEEHIKESTISQMMINEQRKTTDNNDQDQEPEPQEANQDEDPISVDDSADDQSNFSLKTYKTNKTTKTSRDSKKKQASQEVPKIIEEEPAGEQKPQEATPVEQPTLEVQETEQVQEQEPQIEEVQEQEPVAEETPDQEPQVEEVPEQEPEAEETPEQQPQVEEVPEQEPVAEETPEQEPQAEEVPEQEPAAEEAPEQEPQVEEVPEQEPVAEEAPEQEPHVEEVQDNEPEAEESPKQESQVEEVQDNEPEAEESPEQEPKVEEAPEQEPATEEAPEAEESPEQEPVAEEEPQEAAQEEEQKEDAAEDQSPAEDNAQDEPQTEQDADKGPQAENNDE